MEDQCGRRAEGAQKAHRRCAEGAQKVFMPLSLDERMHA